jgi:glycosyltransferase involved in cell wall biosynthesis
MVSQMQIAHVTATFPPYRGGTGNVCYYNARELARRGHGVHVFTAAVPGAPANEECEGFMVHRLRRLLRIGNAPVLPGLLRALRRFDLIHLHYPFYGGELTTMAARLYRTPMVLTYHQDVFLRGPIDLVAHGLRQTVGRLTLRSAAQLLFTSRDYGQASYARTMLHNREHLIGELPNGVDAKRFSPTERPTSLQIRHQLSDGDRITLLVAGLDSAHYFKGIDIFLAALAELPVNVKGLIVGDGDLRPRYEATASAYGLADRVKFAGRVSDEQLPDYYRLADVTVLPSTTSGEAFGLVLLESLASETPVIATNLPGVRTVVCPGKDGLLVEPNDPRALAVALGDLFRDEAARQAMGRRGRTKVVASYTWEMIGGQLEAIYEQVLSSTSISSTSHLRGTP